MRTLENIFNVIILKEIKIILILSLFCAFTLHAQIKGGDSLEQILQTEISDSLRLRVLQELTARYQFVDYVKSFNYANEATILAEKIGSHWAKASSYKNLAYCYTLSGDYSTALKYDDRALQNSLLSKDSAMIAQAFNYLGNDYYDIGEYDEAYFYFTQSYNTAKKIYDSLSMTIALHNVGRVFKELGEYDRAMSHLSLSLKISNKIKDRIALAYYYDELGDIQLRKAQYDSALNTLVSSLKLSRRYQLEELKPKTLTKIANVYLKKNAFDKAFAYYDTTFARYQRTNNQFGLAQVYLGRGIVYLNQGEFDKAEDLIDKSLAAAHNFNARILEINCYQNLYIIAEKRGEFEKALSHFKQYKALEDSLFSQEMVQKLYRDQIRLETESRDSQIAALSQLESRQKEALKREEFIRNILAVVVALSAILLVTVYRSGQRRKEINKLLLQHQEDMEKRSEELERLNQVKDKFFSIISHDLRSPINALSGILDIMSRGGLSQQEFADQTKELRHRFNHTRTLLNNLLDWTLLQMDKLSLQPARIDLHKIVDENIQLITSLQSKQINLVNRIPENAFGYADSNTVNLVIRNLMTNAIKFTNDGGEVTISADKNENHWVIGVHDNGIGINREIQQILFDKTSPYTTRGTANEKGTGLGLILCKEFVEKNNGRIWVESQENKGSTFWFTIPKVQ
ncbi:MAG TPA: tetratricopeptide repeat-containing sensor histidine kinase [Cyclobacteriaceae bacterium]|nr:tetratricopeptide repeat-containing sensor histidine kinase [Cyclobacteriaceae bacterium]